MAGAAAEVIREFREVLCQTMRQNGRQFRKRKFQILFMNKRAKEKRNMKTLKTVFYIIPVIAAFVIGSPKLTLSGTTGYKPPGGGGKPPTKSPVSEKAKEKLIQEVNVYCCEKGKIIRKKMRKLDIAQNRNCSTSKKTISSTCGWCCKDGKSLLVTDSSSNRKCDGGSDLYSSESNAKSNCGWCCKDGRVFSVTAQRQCGIPGSTKLRQPGSYSSKGFWYSTRSKAKESCRPKPVLVSKKIFCNINKRTRRMSEKKCQVLGGQSFKTRGLATMALVREKRKIAKKKLDLPTKVRGDSKDTGKIDPGLVTPRTHEDVGIERRKFERAEGEILEDQMHSRESTSSGSSAGSLSGEHSWTDPDPTPETEGRGGNQRDNNRLGVSSVKKPKKPDTDPAPRQDGGKIPGYPQTGGSEPDDEPGKNPLGIPSLGGKPVVQNIDPVPDGPGSFDGSGTAGLSKEADCENPDNWSRRECAKVKERECKKPEHWAMPQCAEDVIEDDLLTDPVGDEAENQVLEVNTSYEEGIEICKNKCTAYFLTHCTDIHIEAHIERRTKHGNKPNYVDEETCMTYHDETCTERCKTMAERGQ